MNLERNDYLTVQLAEDSGIKDTNNLRVYAVNNSGNVIQTAGFDGLQANIKSGRDADKIYIGPALPEETPSSKINERTLIGIGAYQTVKNITNDNILNVQRLPDHISVLPKFHFCNITGHVNKNFTVNGQVKNLPVCNARVHICNVERIFYWPVYIEPVFRIPDWVLNEFKTKIIDAQQPVFKVPPRPGPDPVFKTRLEKRNLPLQSLTKKAGLSNAFDANKKAEAFNFNRTAEAPNTSNNLQKLPDDVVSEIQSATTESIQQILINYHNILYPYICLWPIFWPWFYRCEEEAVVTTDCNGHFDDWLFYVGNTISENIYVWVEADVNGVWETVYKPAIPCATKWNYTCGTHINVLVSDVRVLPCVCDPVEGEVVWVRSVNNTSVRHIGLHGNEASVFSDSRGLAKGFVGDSNSYNSPFTGGFSINVGFGNNLPSANITHFRWKHRRIADGNLIAVNEPFYCEQQALYKAYTYFAPNMDGVIVGFNDVFRLDESGDKGTIYKIPHYSAVTDTGIDTAVWNNYITDTIDIIANSAADHFGDGLFEFVMELCDNHGNVQTVDSTIFQVDSLLTSPSDPASVPAADIDSPNSSYLFHGTNNSSQADPITGFRFLLRIDNNATTCKIHNAVVINTDGTQSTTDTICGFANYKKDPSGQVLLNFDADQLHRYADYSFTVYKGNSGNPVPPYTGQVPAILNNAVVNGVPVSFQEDPSVAALLGSCDRAAFSENLNVAAYHTDGNQRYYYYDTSDVAAFAIEPEA